MDYQDELIEDARSWALSLQDPSFDRWDEFTMWLENGSDRLRCYEQALEEVAWVNSLLDHGKR